MYQKKCLGCGAVQFYGNTEEEQCPQFCAHCGFEINEKFVPIEERDRSDGPTIMEYVDQGNSALEYPPKGFKERPWSIADLTRLNELSDIEDKYNALMEKKVKKD